MGSIFKVPAMIVYFVGGIWGLIICLGIVYAKLGFFGVLAGLVLFPAVLYLAPWYVAIADHNWYPVLVVYGTGIGAFLLMAIGSMLDRD